MTSVCRVLVFPHPMRRLIASLVLSVVAWGPLAPLAIASAGDPIPACCRRDGKHHCMMSMAGMGAANDGSTSVRTVPGPCPYRSQRATPASTAHPQGPLALSAQLPHIARIALPEFLNQNSRRPSSTPQRGPPQALLATNR